MGEITEEQYNGEQKSHSQDKVEIVVRTIGPARPTRLQLPSSIRVLDLRELIADSYQLPIEKLRLIMQGSVLHDSKSGHDVYLRLKDGDSLIVAVKPKPPAKHLWDGLDDDDEDDLKFQLPGSRTSTSRNSNLAAELQRNQRELEEMRQITEQQAVRYAEYRGMMVQQQTQMFTWMQMMYACQTTGQPLPTLPPVPVFHTHPPPQQSPPQQDQGSHRSSNDYMGFFDHALELQRIQRELEEMRQMTEQQAVRDAEYWGMMVQQQTQMFTWMQTMYACQTTGQPLPTPPPVPVFHTHPPPQQSPPQQDQGSHQSSNDYMDFFDPDAGVPRP